MLFAGVRGWYALCILKIVCSLGPIVLLFLQKWSHVQCFQGRYETNTLKLWRFRYKRNNSDDVIMIPTSRTKLIDFGVIYISVSVEVEYSNFAQLWFRLYTVQSLQRHWLWIDWFLFYFFCQRVCYSILESLLTLNRDPLTGILSNCHNTALHLKLDITCNTLSIICSHCLTFMQWFI